MSLEPVRRSKRKAAELGVDEMAMEGEETVPGVVEPVPMNIDETGAVAEHPPHDAAVMAAPAVLPPEHHHHHVEHHQHHQHAEVPMEVAAPPHHQPHPHPHPHAAPPPQVPVPVAVAGEVPLEGGGEDEVGPPIIKKPRRDIAEAAAKAIEEDTTPIAIAPAHAAAAPPPNGHGAVNTTTTEEEIAKTMVEAHATAAAAAEEAMKPAAAPVPMVVEETKPPEETTEAAVTIVDQNQAPVPMENNNNHQTVVDPVQHHVEQTVPAPSPVVATAPPPPEQPTTTAAPAPPPPAAPAPSIPMEAPKPAEAAMPVKQEEVGIANNAIAAEAVAAMGSIPVPAAPQQPPQQQQQPQHPTPIYKKEQEEYEEPDDGMEIPEEEDSVWNARLLDLLLYKAQYRTLHVQATYDQPLHSWVDVQRRLYRRHRKDPKSVSAVTQTRLTALDAINFPFTLRGAAHWDRYYAKLQEFNKKHGHCLVPRLCEFAGLGDWVIDQRRQYKLMMQGKPSVLDPERQRKLEELGFVWVVRNRPEWNNRYQELLAYKEKYGDTKVPQHYKEIAGLGKWVAKQREQYRLLSQGKHSFLTPDRLEKLNDAGFVWSVRKDASDDLGKKKALVDVALKKDVVPAAAAATPMVTDDQKPKEVSVPMHPGATTTTAAPVPTPQQPVAAPVAATGPPKPGEEPPKAPAPVVMEQAQHPGAPIQQQHPQEMKKEDGEKKEEAKGDEFIAV